MGLSKSAILEVEERRRTALANGGAAIHRPIVDALQRLDHAGRYTRQVRKYPTIGDFLCTKTKVDGRTSLVMEYRRPDAAGKHVWMVRVYTVPLTQGQLMITLSNREDASASAAMVAAILGSVHIL